MNISQHCFVPLGFKTGYYNDNKVYVPTTQYPTWCSELLHVDNCNACVVYRQVGTTSPVPVGFVLRFFDGESFSFKIGLQQVDQFPYSFNFTPASDMEFTVSYGIPAGMVDFLVYDNPNVQPTRMRLGSLNDLNDEEIQG